MTCFQERENGKLPAERIPGTAIGKMMRIMAPKRVAPSMRAHSSSSLGIVLKYPIKSQVLKGMRNVGYVRMSAHGVVPSWKLRMMAASGVNSSGGGQRQGT